MTLVEVYVVGSEPVEACMTAIDDAVYRFKLRRIVIPSGPVPDLCGYIDLRSFGTKRSAGIKLALTYAIGVGGVEQVYPCIQRRVDSSIDGKSCKMLSRPLIDQMK